MGGAEFLKAVCLLAMRVILTPWNICNYWMVDLYELLWRRRADIARSKCSILGANPEYENESTEGVGQPTHLLMLRVLRTHNIHSPLPPHNTASIAHNLDRRPNLHSPRKSGCYRARQDSCRERMVVVRMRMSNGQRSLAQALEKRSAGCQ